MRSLSPAAPDRHSTPSAALRRGLVALAALAVLAMLTAAGMAPTAAQDRPPGGVLSNPVVRAIDLASPAVVRIATLYSAHITLSACGATATLPSSGAYTVGGLGSGAFVSANGDILTADHVVDIDHQSLDGAIFAGEHASVDIATFLNTACHPSTPVTADDVANGIVQFNGFPFTTTYSAPRVLVWRSASYFGALSGASSADETELNGLLRAPYKEASVVKASSFGQDDLALLHVAMTDTPNIQLDPSSQLAVEDTLAVIGFPGNGDVNGDPTNLLTPSVNNVTVSALKHNDNGSQLIQVGGNVEHGDSGGPALDTAGHIVGIVSFGGPDTQGITAFLRSSDSALALLNATHISTKPGAFQTLWQQAFTDYADTTPGHWHTASREMDALSTRYPDFHGLDAYRGYADAAAVRETSSSSSTALIPALPLPLPLLAALVAGVVLVLLLLLVIASLRRRRRRSKQQAAPLPLPVWPSAGLPQGYSGATAPSYPPMAYNAQAQPTRPALPQQRSPAYPPAYPPVSYPQQPYPQQQPTYAPAYGSPYPGFTAPQNGAVSQPGSVAAATPAQDVQLGAPESRDARPTPPAGTPSSNGASERCANGHPMAPGATRCLVCGAERMRPAVSAPSAPSAPGAVSLPPWAQNS